MSNRLLNFTTQKNKYVTINKNLVTPVFRGGLYLLKYKDQLYEYFMLILALLSVSLIWIDLGVFNYIIFVVWGIFLIDIIVRIYRARSKFIYMLKNPFDIVAVIPLDSFFLLARFSRFISVLRIKSILTRYTVRLQKWVSTLNLVRVTAGFFFVVLVLNLAVWMMLDITVMETIRWSYLSMYVFDYGKGTDALSILIITLILKVSYILYVGYLVNLFFTFLLSMEVDLMRIYYRFRNKKDRLFYHKLSETSKKHREAAGYNQQINSEIMTLFEQQVHKSDVQKAAVSNAERGLRNVYIKLNIKYNSEIESMYLEPNYENGVRGLEYNMEISVSSLILSPADLTLTLGFKNMLRKFPFLELHLNVFNAPDFVNGEISWIEVRCFWEKYL